MTAPNWIDLDVMKSDLYLDIKGAASDASIVLLGEQITARAISYLNTDDYTDDPNPELVRAVHMQANYEWRQRHFVGLTSVQHQDGSVSKYQTSQWLDEVKAVLDRNRMLTIYPTT